MHSPCKVHLEVVHKILKYLKGTPGKGLLFKKNGGRSIRGIYRCRLDWFSKS